jgi:hypothetical protein
MVALLTQDYVRLYTRRQAGWPDLCAQIRRPLVPAEPAVSLGGLAAQVHVTLPAKAFSVSHAPSLCRTRWSPAARRGLGRSLRLARHCRWTSRCRRCHRPRQRRRSRGHAGAVTREQLGTLWIVADRVGHFDRGHVAAIQELASFVSVAHQRRIVALPEWIYKAEHVNRPALLRVFLRFGAGLAETAPASG